MTEIALAALGSIPWVGGFISAAVSLKTEEGDLRANKLQTQWLEEHEHKMQRLAETLNDIAHRFETLGDQINERVQSEEYLDLVRKAFRTWDQADTDEKRKYVANLISRALNGTVAPIEPAEQSDKPTPMPKTPTIKNGTIPPRRLPNRERRSREHLTPSEVEEIMKVARARAGTVTGTRR